VIHKAATLLLIGFTACLWLAPAAAQQDRDASALNVSIAVFDPGVPADPSLYRDLQVFPRIRRIEALFLPFVLRDTMGKSNQWGAVRVVPETDVGAELLVTGTILRSDGERLQLHLRAIDASGRVWLDRDYTGAYTADDEQSELRTANAVYQELYDEIATDLLAVRSQLDNRTLTNIVEISLLRYASQLAPSAFGDYLDSEPDGTFRVLRLPARNDSTLERIERIRSVEYVLTDAVDQKFQELHSEIERTYDMWRKYRRQFTLYQKEEAARIQNGTSDASRGSFEAMRSSYENYKWDRLAKQEQDKWVIGFDNEVGPTVAHMESRVAEIRGWVDQNYTEWSRLLEEIFSLETGLQE